jgi:transcriptional regulator with XRE-family HTH domain
MAGDRADLSLGDRMRELRQERGWTRAALAEHAGLHESVVTAVEDGVTVPVGMDAIQRLAGAFGLMPADLLGDR